MNVIHSAKLQKSLKRTNFLLFFGSAFLIFTIIFIGFLIFSYQTKSMNSLIVDGIEKNTYANIKVSAVPYKFAETEDTKEPLYFVFDQENHLYVALLNQETYNQLKKEDIEKNPVLITGKTKKIPKELQAIAIETYNEIKEEETLNEENFEKYLGNIYLDTTDAPDHLIPTVLTVIGVALTIYIFVTYYFRRKNTKEIINSFTEEEWEKVEKELDSPTTIDYPELQLYFTENYIVSLAVGIDIFSYQDILWMYPHILRQYGVTTNKSLILVTKDKKFHDIANIDNFSKKSNNKYEDVMSFIYDKNSQMLVGYTKEHIQEMKDTYGIK